METLLVHMQINARLNDIKCKLPTVGYIHFVEFKQSDKVWHGQWSMKQSDKPSAYPVLLRQELQTLPFVALFWHYMETLLVHMQINPGSMTSSSNYLQWAIFILWNSSKVTRFGMDNGV